MRTGKYHLHSKEEERRLKEETRRHQEKAGRSKKETEILKDEIIAEEEAWGRIAENIWNSENDEDATQRETAGERVFVSVSESDIHMPEELRKKCMKQIRRHYRRERRQTFGRRAGFVLLRFSAVVCVFLLVFTTSLAASPSLRESTYEIASKILTGTSSAEDTKTDYPLIVLTDEEAEKDHLTGQISEKVTIDAYITPRSQYADGVSQWTTAGTDEAEESVETVSAEESEASAETVSADGSEESEETASTTDANVIEGTFESISGDETVLNSVSFSEFTALFDTFAGTLGETWVEKWNKVKEFNYSRLYFWMDDNGEITIYTPGTWNANGISSDLGYGWGCEAQYYGLSANLVSGFYLVDDSERNTSFLKRRTFRYALEELMDSLYPEAADRYSLYVCSEETLAEMGCDASEISGEWYTAVCYETIEGLAVKRAPYTLSIPAGEMAEDSIRYSENGIEATSDGMAYELININVTENGFECILRPRLNLVEYSAAREVADINEIIENMTAQIKKRTGTSIVTEIELVMNYVVAQDEDGKYRIVYSPIWRVEYYNQMNKDADWKRYLMTFDGYTGELNYDLITY